MTTADTETSVQCIQCSAHGIFSCQETVGTCGICSTRNTDINRYRSGAYEAKPESICLDCLAAGKHMTSAHDRAEADVDTIEHLARRPVGQGGFTPSWKEKA